MAQASGPGLAWLPPGLGSGLGIQKPKPDEVKPKPSPHNTSSIFSTSPTSNSLISILDRMCFVPSGHPVVIYLFRSLCMEANNDAESLGMFQYGKSRVLSKFTASAERSRGIEVLSCLMCFLVLALALVVLHTISSTVEKLGSRGYPVNSGRRASGSEDSENGSMPSLMSMSTSFPRM
ncbi:hypothetical protein B0H13DRAFT_1921514 [Mycena leptocephala]|nr:hypothetical protein B0H13DRAFT_1921514 [Mycena leptocephala]